MNRYITSHQLHSGGSRAGLHLFKRHFDCAFQVIELRIIQFEFWPACTQAIAAMCSLAAIGIILFAATFAAVSKAGLAAINATSIGALPGPVALLGVYGLLI